MTEQSFDICVSGGGLAGLVATTAFAQAGFSVLCVDPSPQEAQPGPDHTDLRTTAFLQPSKLFLQEIGLWEHVQDFAAPLQVMRIIDASGPDAKPRVIKDFDASDISDAPFGWNIPNRLLRLAFLSHVQSLPNVELRHKTATTGVFARQTEARVSLDDGSFVSTRLLIAADGRNSTVRQAAGIKSKTIRYGQKALALAVSHPIPHENVSTEIHRTGGPFTLVPLPDHSGMPCSGLVWMERGAKAQALFDLEDAAFETAMTERSCGVLGPLTLASKRSIWPIIGQLAQRMSAERVALVAEAAHVVTPIGAQGLNMSLADIQKLRDLATARPDELGDAKMLNAYHAARHGEVSIRVHGIDLLNRASMVQLPLFQNARALGLEALYALPPVRKTLMQMGLGMRAR